MSPSSPDPRTVAALARLVRNALTDEALEDADTAARRAAIHEGTHWLDAFRDGIADQLDGPLTVAVITAIRSAAEDGYVAGRSKRPWGDAQPEIERAALRALTGEGASDPPDDYEEHVDGGVHR